MVRVAGDRVHGAKGKRAFPKADLHMPSLPSKLWRRGRGAQPEELKSRARQQRIPDGAHAQAWLSEVSMLTRTAAPEASTTGCAIHCHSHGVMRVSMRLQRRIPAGNMNPMSIPAGTTVMRQTALRSMSDPVSA